MFVISLTYVTPLAQVDALLPKHNEFLNKQYAAGRFLLSGRKEPRTGGVIIADAPSKRELLDILENDPFKIHGVARYDIEEFAPSRSRADLEHLLPEQ